MLNKVLLAVVTVCVVALVVLYGMFEKKRQETAYFESVKTEQNNRQPQTGQDTTSQALDPNVIDSLKKLKPGILTSSILKNSYTGTLIKLDTTGGTLSWADNFTYKAALQLKNTKGETNTFYYNAQEVEKMRVLIGNTPIKLQDLKLNDSIVIEEELDLTRGWNTNIIAVTVYKQ